MTTHETGTARMLRLRKAVEDLGPIDYHAAAEIVGITSGTAWAFQWSLGWVGAHTKLRPSQPWFAPVPPEEP